MSSKRRQSPVKTITKGKRAEKLSGDDLHVRVAEMPPAQREETAGEGGSYVYGIISCSQPASFGKIGIGGAGEMVYTINYGDIAAAVSGGAAGETQIPRAGHLPPNARRAGGP